LFVGQEGGRAGEVLPSAQKKKEVTNDYATSLI